MMTNNWVSHIFCRWRWHKSFSNGKNSFSLRTYSSITLTYNCFLQKRWCVAKENIYFKLLLSNIEFACAHGADCDAIKAVGNCYEPNTLTSHASFAMNSYYHKLGVANDDNCYFNSSGLIVYNDPSKVALLFDVFTLLLAQTWGVNSFFLWLDLQVMVIVYIHLHHEKICFWCEFDGTLIRLFKVLIFWNWCVMSCLVCLKCLRFNFR